MHKKLYYYFLIVSPLIYLTGGIEHVTPLSIAGYLDLPSLSLINYIFFLWCVFFLHFYSFGKNISWLYLLDIVIIMIIFRESRVDSIFFSTLSQFLILSPLFLLVGCKIHIGYERIKKISYIFVFYLICSILLHYIFIMYYKYIGFSLPNERAVGIFKNPNHLAAFSILLLIFLYNLAFIKLVDVKKIFFAELIVAVTVYLSGSRSSQVFFIILLLIHSFLYNKRFFSLYCCLAVLSVAYVGMSDIGVDKIEQLLTKRETKDIAEAGNMRMSILFDMLENFNFREILIGKGSGQGTAVYITNQSNNNEKITWLDSNVNTLTYTYGVVFLIFSLAAMLLKMLFLALMKRTGEFYIFFFVFYFMWFINIGEFFPLIFMLLIQVSTSNMGQQHDINNYYKL